MRTSHRGCCVIMVKASTLWILDRIILVLLVVMQNSAAIKPTKRVVFTSDVRKRVMSRQQWRCMYCGGRRKTQNFEIDHIHPVSRGGSNEESNLQALCGPCNARKGAATDEEFRRRYAELLPRLKPSLVPTPPDEYIYQHQFRALTRRTATPKGVRTLRRNKYLTQRQRIMKGAPIAGVIVGIIWAGITAALLSGLPIFIELSGSGGVIVFLSVWVAVYKRAKRCGVMTDE